MLMDMQPSGEGRLPDHGRVACTACFGGEAVVFDASRTGSTNWRITANPCAWGNPNAEVVVLGFSKGPTQAGALARTPHDEIAYKGARHNVGRILHAVGLLENGAKVDDLITDQKGRLAFGSLVRCTVEQRDIRKGTWKGAGGDMLGGHCHVVWGPSKFDREAEFA